MRHKAPEFNVLCRFIISKANFEQGWTKDNGEYYLLGYNAVYMGISPVTFQRKALPPSSGPKNKLSKKQARSRRQVDPAWLTLHSDHPTSSPKRRWTSTGLHGISITYQKIVLFVVTAVRTRIQQRQ
jgi:hypothetical protein